MTAQYLKDSFPHKVNLGQGTYRDADGKPWVLPSVHKARQNLLEQGLNHEYLPILGLSTFQQAAAELILGSELFAQRENKVRNKTYSYIGTQPVTQCPGLTRSEL